MTEEQKQLVDTGIYADLKGLARKWRDRAHRNSYDIDGTRVYSNRGLELQDVILEMDRVLEGYRVRENEAIDARQALADLRAGVETLISNLQRQGAHAFGEKAGIALHWIVDDLRAILTSAAPVPASPEPSAIQCPDCREARMLAFSDATTPGFFSPYCPLHTPPESVQGCTPADSSSSPAAATDDSGRDGETEYADL